MCFSSVGIKNLVRKIGKVDVAKYMTTVEEGLLETIQMLNYMYMLE